MRRISNNIMATVVDALGGSARDGLSELADAFGTAVGAGAVAIDDGRLAARYPATDEGRAYLTEGPLIPDQIVYAGSFPVVLEEGVAVADAVAAFRSAHGTDPVVAVAPGLGVIAAGESARSAGTALEVFVDALTVVEAANRLGRVRALDERERSFIENWEAEAYRQQVARS
ncbi:hypothetical protein G7085_06315 [Tessaracoccus sp. HDW20]|nr:hypothetical protein [Tessaracoccus coleopterorum]NHB84345.1 hypothetical protein [Tessaracoccus coleopterorum]